MNRTWIKGLFLFSCLFCCGCDLIYGMIQKEGAEEKKILGNVPPYESNPVVEEVQELLKIYGYKLGSIDGKFGTKTREAIASFQKDHNLKVTRFLDKKTYTKLTEFTQSGIVQDGEISPKGLQKALNAAGYDTGGIDGRMGKKTQAALKDFQKDHGLKPDGVIGAKTLKELTSYLMPQK